MYIGRDLHRIRGDGWFGRVATVTLLWIATGIALAGVGLFPIEAIVIGIGLVWLTTLVRILAVLTPAGNRASARGSLLRA